MLCIEMDNVNLGKVVELGGGRVPHPDADVNIDWRDLPEVTLVHDLNNGIALDDNCAKKIYIHHLLEHVISPYQLMKDVIRIARNGAEIDIEFPNPDHPVAWEDPEHKYSLTPEFFKQFGELKIVESKEHYPSPRLGRLPILKRKFPFSEYRLKLRVTK